MILSTLKFSSLLLHVYHVHMIHKFLILSPQFSVQQDKHSAGRGYRC